MELAEVDRQMATVPPLPAGPTATGGSFPTATLSFGLLTRAAELRHRPVRRAARLLERARSGQLFVFRPEDHFRRFLDSRAAVAHLSWA